MSRNRPSAEELTHAVRLWLEEELRPALKDSAQQYKARVAINVLTLVERELRLGQSQSEREQQWLQDFLGQSGDLKTLNETLIQHIHTGALDDKQAELLALLHNISLGKLAIDNPRYSTSKKYQS